jgi:hypothetical protein
MKNNVLPYFVPKWNVPFAYVIDSCGFHFPGYDEFSITIAVTSDVPL